MKRATSMVKSQANKNCKYQPSAVTKQAKGRENQEDAQEKRRMGRTAGLGLLLLFFLRLLRRCLGPHKFIL